MVGVRDDLDAVEPGLGMPPGRQAGSPQRSQAAAPPADAAATGAAPSAPARSGWVAALVLAGAALSGLLLLFAEEAAAAVRVWDSAAYNHCWLVLPIALWLGWTRRHRLEGLQPSPAPLFALLALPLGLAWLLAERLGIMEGRQLTALAMVHVLALTLFGWRICRAMAAPLLYLVFLVPFGAFSVPVLQRITAWMIELGLRALEIPHYVDELIIETTAGTFLVAEACAGLRFLIATLAFGTLYALVMFRSPGRRLIVLGLALVVPIVANGFRAFGIVLLGHYLGSAEAAAADHIVYGWLFFSVVLLLLIAAGLPFREDGAPEPRPAAPPSRLPAPRMAVLAAAALLASGLAAAAPALAFTLRQAAAGTPERVAVPLAELEGCSAGGAGLACGPLSVSAEAVVFPAQVTWGQVSGERIRATGLDDQDLTFTLRSAGATWQARQSRETGRTVAVATWLNGRPAGGGIRSRAEQAWNSLGAGRGRPVLVAITLAPEQDEALVNAARQRALVEAVLAAQGDRIAAQAAALSAGR